MSAWSMPALGLGLLCAMGATGAVAHAACTAPPTLAAKLRAHPTTENAVQVGSWFAGHQQFPCAVDTFRTALKADPESAQLHYLTGLAMVGAGNTTEGAGEVRTSIRLEPQVLKPHLFLASLDDEAGRHAQAEEEWKAALKIDPRSEQALEGLGAGLIARQDYAGAIALLKSAPRTEKLSITLAQALGLLNYLNEAAAVLTEAMQAAPGSLPLANAMTVVLVKQHHYQEAINLVQHTVADHPSDIDTQVQLFRLLVLTNHIDLARPIGPKLLAVRPQDPDVLSLNGIVQRAVGNYPQAKALLEKAVALDPNFFNSRYNLGMVLVFLREWPEAKENLEKAIALGATEPQVHFELAKALRGLAENDRAADEMKLYQQLKKDEESALEAVSAAAQGDKDLAAGNVTEAITHYREATQDEPANAAYKFQLATALHTSGDLDGERAQLEQAIKLDPQLAGAQNELGFLLARSGQAPEALDHFRAAVQAAPGWTEAWINLAAELAESAQFGEAREAAAKALALDPENAQAQKLSDRLAHDPAAQQAHP